MRLEPPITSYRNRWRSLLLALFALIVVVAGVIAGWAWFYGRAWLDHTIRERIESTVRRATVEGYHFELDSLSAEFLSGDVRVIGIRLTYDSTLNDSLRHGVYDYLFSAHASNITLRGLSIWRAILKREVLLNVIEVDTPAFHYTIGDRRVALNDPFKRLSGDARPLPLLAVASIVVRGARARMNDLSGHLPVLRTSGLDIAANDLRVIRVGDRQRSYLSVGDVDIRMDSLSTDLPGGYRLRFGSTHLSDRTGRGSVQHIVLDQAAEHISEFSTARLTVSVDSLVFLRPDVSGLLGERALTMRSIHVHGMQLAAELDKALPDPPARPVLLPPAALLSLPYPIRIDSLRVIDSAVRYRERSDATGLWGMLTWDQLNATITGILNVPTARTEPSLIIADIACAFMDTAHLQAHYEARLDGSEEFTFTASLHDLPLTSLDSLTSNLLRLSLRSGSVEHMQLVMKGDADNARGSMQLDYADLVTTVAPTATIAQRRSMLGSVMDYVLTEERGGGLSDSQRRNVSIDRNKDRSLFTYIWHFTRAGLKRGLRPGVKDRVRTLLRKDRSERRRTPRSR